MSSSKKVKRSTKDYTPEYRNQVVKLVLSHEKSISQTAKDLGLPLATLYTLVKKAQSGEWLVESDNLTAGKLEQDTRPTPQKAVHISQKLYDLLRAEQKKNADLERQVRRLMQEREILKKAMAYCLDVPK